MSVVETSLTASIGSFGLDGQDVEKAEPASSYSRSSTIVEPSASTKSTAAQVEQGEVTDSLPKNTLSFSRTFESFLWRKASATFPKTAAHFEARYNKKEIQKQTLRKLYSKLITQRPSIEDYPEGWPQLAAFLHSEDNFTIFRRFGMTHCRVLVQLQAEIQLLENQLSELDIQDHEGGPETSWRLHMADIEDGREACHAAQRNLLQKLQEKLLVYDQLLLNDKNLRELGGANRNDHLSVYHWIYTKKPLGTGQYDWINYATDFIALSKATQFEYSILNSVLKTFFRSPENKDKADNEDKTIGTVTHYSSHLVASAAKLISVMLAVTILVVPVFILLWIPETRAWISVTVLISVFMFSALMSLLTDARVQEVLVGTAAYCAVLATFLGNIQANSNVK